MSQYTLANNTRIYTQTVSTNAHITRIPRTANTSWLKDEHVSKLVRHCLWLVRVCVFEFEWQLPNEHDGTAITHYEIESWMATFLGKFLCPCCWLDSDEFTISVSRDFCCCTPPHPSHPFTSGPALSFSGINRTQRVRVWPLMKLIDMW